MRVLVTGAAGFLGRHLTSHLSRTHDIIALVRRPLENPVSGASEVLVGGLDDPTALLNYGKPIDAVCHVAASVALKDTVEEREKLWRDNILATQNLLTVCQMLSINRLVYSSSVSVYDQPVSELPVHEDARIRPINSYGCSKWVGEWMVSSSLLPPTTVRFILRYSSIYGKGQRPDAVLPIFIRRVLDGQPPKLFGRGTRSQDFVYVEDICTLNARCLESDPQKPVSIYNGGSGVETSMAQLARDVINVFGQPGLHEAESIDVASEDTTRFFLDISKASRDLGYHPSDLLDGLTKLRGEGNLPWPA